MHCSPTSSCLSGSPTSSRTRRRSSPHSTQSLPESWRFDTWAVIKTVERDFGQWVRGQLILGFVVGFLTFVGLIVLSRTVDPIFGRYAVLLSVLAGLLELVPIIGPIISAVPAVLLAATAGLGPVIWVLVLYFAVQQTENNLLVPKIQGDAVQLHPAAVVFAIIVGGSLAGLLGAILALPVTAAFRDVVRYLFRRLSPDEPAALALSLDPIGMIRPMPDAINPYKILQVDPEAEDEVITAAYRRLARKYHPDLAATPDAPARMAAINAAWELIGDPDKRADIRPNAPRGGSGYALRVVTLSVAVSCRSERRRGRGRLGSRAAASTPPGDPTGPGWPGRQAASRHRPSSSRGTGRPAGRPTVAVSMNRCARAQATRGPPPGRPSGRVLNFGRYAGWSLGEIARQDLEYIEWLDRMPIGRPYRDEIDGSSAPPGRRRSEAGDADDRRGLYRRR